MFRDEGQATAADYAKAASVATAERRAVGDWEFFDFLDYNRPINRRYIFIIKLLRGAFDGLAHMHSKGRLHQSLGPASVVIKYKFCLPLLCADFTFDNCSDSFN